MTNYQVRILCYAIFIAAGALMKGIASTAYTPHSSEEAMGGGTFLMIVGFLLFIAETLVVSFKKKQGSVL